MNPFFKKAKSVHKRLTNTLQVAFFPEQVYLYQKKLHLYHNFSYSQEGEDMILSRFFGSKTHGFYVDIGAHHPQRFSNTYYFYLQGWRGINIDPLPGSMEAFNKTRPNDINLEVPISDSNQVLTYYQFNDPALNGFSDEISKERDGLDGYKIISTKELRTYRLDEILDKYLPINQEIDFLSVDVEGLDLQVLKSNNWQKYRPKMVLAEELNRSSLCLAAESKLDSFMDEQDYQLYAKAVNTLFFVRKN
jgi:FkbM family methyltransferase